MKARNVLWGIVLAAVSAGPALADQAQVERGRYLVKVGGCNDCHTPGYPQSGGQVPESDWLTGNPVGFSGPWGTTYPRNLRLFTQELTEAEWMMTVREPKRPPMPWFNLAAMTEDDQRAIYQFIRSLGPKGAPAPAFVEPGQTVNSPYIEFVPKNLPQQQARAE
jgi:mono/diheme cytochrome c family protein